jgi:hypothetical protein
LIPFVRKNNVNHWGRLTVSIILIVGGKLGKMGTKKQKNVPGKIDGQLPIVVKKLRMI